jgi:hypothetical protein
MPQRIRFGAVAEEEFGLGAALAVERVGRLPQFLVTPATLQRLREVLPCQVRVTARSHPLCGRALLARGFRRLRGELMLAVLLPDGSAGTVPAAATDVLGEQPQAEPGPGAVLTAEGARRLRALLVAKSRGSRRSRGTAAARPRLSSTFAPTRCGGEPSCEGSG